MDLPCVILNGISACHRCVFGLRPSMCNSERHQCLSSLRLRSSSEFDPRWRSSGFVPRWRSISLFVGEVFHFFASPFPFPFSPHSAEAHIRTGPPVGRGCKGQRPLLLTVPSLLTTQIQPCWRSILSPYSIGTVVAVLSRDPPSVTLARTRPHHIYRTLCAERLVDPPNRGPPGAL